MKTLEEVKALASAGSSVAEMQFKNAKGSVGTVRAELSSRGKLQADMTCVVDGCTNTHLREVSDWHQCSKCRDHAGKATAKPVVAVTMADRAAAVSAVQDRIKAMVKKYAK